MKKILILAVIAAITLAGCSSKKEAAVKAAAGTPAYDLAKELMKTIPALDPAKASLLVTSKSFDVSAVEAIQFLIDQYGASSSQLKTLDAANLKTALEQGAQQLGERKLLLAAAIEAKTVSTPEELKTALDAQYAQAGGEAQFVDMLKQRSMDFEFVKKSIGEDLKIQKYLQTVLAAAGKVTDDDVKKAYAEDKTASARHILLLTKDKTDAQKAEIRKRMDGLLARAKKGEDFAALAKEFSEDTGSKETGGLYEDFGRGKMVKPFDEAAFSVPVGQISGVVETIFGYHIIKVEGRKKETEPFDKIKDQLTAQLKEQRQAAAFEAHLTAMKDKAKFKIQAL
jgi:parvulin-like peptidyl-prolyl isomerase